MRKCAIIYNPESGKVKKKNLFNDKFNGILEESGYEAVYYPTKRSGDATKYAEKIKNADLIICCGGDGTLNETVNGMLKRKEKVLMAHLPFGTTNDVGAMYGYTKNYLTNLALLLRGSRKNIDTCLINGRPFVYVACFGNYVDISYNTPRKLKKRYGRLGYIINALKEIRNHIKTYDLTYIIDGEEHKGTYSFIFVSNSSRIAGFDNVYTDVKLDDGKFEVMFCDFKNKRQLIKSFTKMLTTDIRKIPGIEYYRTDNLSIHFDKKPKESWCMDGEELKHNSIDFDFSVVKDIEMLLPRKNIVKLFNNIEGD